jgi:hypothetical protein
MLPEHHIWVFNGQGSNFPGGIFTDKIAAEAWIAANRLTGVLTAYPVNEGCFDWAVRNGVTNLGVAKLKAKSTDPLFIGGFSTASQEHFHYIDGRPVSA